MHPRYRALPASRPHPLCAVLAVLAALAPAVTAAETTLHARGRLALGPSPGQGFNLHVERRDIDVDYNDGSGGDRLEVTRIGIAWFEAPIRGLQLGIEGGGQELQQSDRPATEGRELSGFYAAVTAASALPLGERLRLELDGRLGFSEVEDDDATTVELEWWSAAIRPAVAVLIGDAVTLRAGATAYWLDGDERVSGATARTTDLTEAATGGGFVGLDVHTGDGGRIGLRAEGGPVRALRLVFERRY